MNIALKPPSEGKKILLSLSGLFAARSFKGSTPPMEVCIVSKEVRKAEFVPEWMKPHNTPDPTSGSPLRPSGHTRPPNYGERSRWL